MARWADVAWLVSEFTQRDGHGVAQVVTSRRMVYCNSRTVGTTAFYAAAQHGARIAAEIEVRRADYHDEVLVEYNGVKGYIRSDFLDVLTEGDSEAWNFLQGTPAPMASTASASFVLEE